MPNPETRQFIERMGLAVERLGLTRTFGRLFGLLLLADGPLSLDEMADRLQISKASVSTNARSCEDLGLARRVGLRGDRRDYYELAPRAFENVMRRWVGAIHSMAGLAAEGLEAVGEKSAPARDRLTVMLDFYLFMGEQIEELLERWREVKG
ncbi:MAG: MarR family transcriptional regulator [Candidatus Palauibacterales bacterium]|nr:MarR family transcriptional regulator [Candidatus Palauibacterales bacterium]MDP2483581.1 MarR family transcriptional regulator [Candidatus Palauibacterales bacterium]